jgi:hypothetical protein
MSTIHIIQEGADPRVATRAASPGHDNRTVSRVPAGGNGPAPASVPEAPALDPRAARQYIEQVQETLDRFAPEPHKITFRGDGTANGFVIEVRNPDGSLVRQYPPEKLLNLRRKLDEMSGMVIDQMT